MHLSKTIAAVTLLTITATAQTQLVRGDVDAIQGTNRFQLECTAIPLVSTTVNLQALHDASRQQDIEYEMQVNNIGTAAAPVLDVISALSIPEMHDMGNLRFGRSETWETFAPSGSLVAVFVNATAATGYLPFGAAGSWLLGTSGVLMRQGTSVGGQFRFNFTMPTLPSTVGVSITSQAVYVDPANTVVITNPDCKDVRAN